MHAQVSNMMDHGVIKADNDGNLWPVDDPEERASIMQSKQKPVNQSQILLGAQDGDKLEMASQHSFHSVHEDMNLDDIS